MAGPLSESSLRCGAQGGRAAAGWVGIRSTNEIPRLVSTARLPPGNAAVVARVRIPNAAQIRTDLSADPETASVESELIETDRTGSLWPYSVKYGLGSGGSEQRQRVKYGLGSGGSEQRQGAEAGTPDAYVWFGSS